MSAPLGSNLCPLRPRVTRTQIRSLPIVLTLVYVLDFLDRNILSILAEDIEADLGLE